MRGSATVLAALAVSLLFACDNAPTAIRLKDVEVERTIWAAHHLTRYAYVYETTGFFIGTSGRQIRLVVLNDSVASAQDVATDSLLPVSPGFPTLDGLFDLAEAALSAGTLQAVAFDSTGYPSRMDLAGPPDASGSILASGLELLP